VALAQADATIALGAVTGSLVVAALAGPLVVGAIAGGSAHADSGALLGFRRDRGWPASRRSSRPPSRRSAHTASGVSTSLDLLVVTHPFHPLRGERLAVLSERRGDATRLYVCEAPSGAVTLPEEATGRGPEPAGRPLTVGVLAELVVGIAGIKGSRGSRGSREGF
jgi:hypothetical protein